MRFGLASRLLRATVAEFARWMTNEYPPWAAYRGLMAGRLIALDKMLGIRPIGIGETWRRLFAKTVILVTGDDTTEACGSEQLCAGLKAGIEGGVHAASAFWDENAKKEDTGFLLIDAKNAFNEMNRDLMLWRIRFDWPKGCRFIFNCYKHWGTLFVRDQDGSKFTLFSKEGVTQGDACSMHAYGIGTLPIVHHMKNLRKKILQLWYADDASFGGNFNDIINLFRELKKIGPGYGYFPEPSKCVLVVNETNLEKAKTFFKEEGFQISTGKRFLGGFLGSPEGKAKYIAKKVSSWE